MGRYSTAAKGSREAISGLTPLCRRDDTRPAAIAFSNSVRTRRKKSPATEPAVAGYMRPAHTCLKLVGIHILISESLIAA